MLTLDTRSGERSCRLPIAAFAAATLLAVAACGGTRGGQVGSDRGGFGTGGKVRTDFGGDDVANALAIQGDGKIVVAGGTGSDFALARHTRKGRLDPSFGTSGKVVTDVGAPPVKYLPPHPGAKALAIQSDGKIIAAGGSGSDFALARYTPDGRLDRSFGTGGKVLTDVGARAADALQASWKNGANAVAIQDDGRIVAAGEGDGVFALTRYMPDGRLDASFGTSGKILTDFGRKVRGSGANDAAIANAIAVQADGKIIAAGRSAEDLALTRYMPDGRLDASFGTGGKVVAKVGSDDFDEANAIALQADGKIVAAGSTWPRNPAWLVVRLTPRGRLDRSFGSAGVAGGRRTGGGASAVAMLRDGKMVVLGGVFVPETSTWSSALIRFTRSGHRDQAFGNGGSVRIQGTAVVIQRDGKMVVAGEASSRSGSSDFLLLRYKPDGSLDR